MKKYYYLLDDKKIGPLTIDELKYGPKSTEIDSATLILVDGAADWTPARDIEELRALTDIEETGKAGAKTPSSRCGEKEEIKSQPPQNSSFDHAEMDSANPQDRLYPNLEATSPSPSASKYIFTWLMAGFIFVFVSLFFLSSLGPMIVMAPDITASDKVVIVATLIPVVSSIFSLITMLSVFRITAPALIVIKTLPYTFILGFPMFFLTAKSILPLREYNWGADPYFISICFGSFVLSNILAPYIIFRKKK